MHNGASWTGLEGRCLVERPSRCQRATHSCLPQQLPPPPTCSFSSRRLDLRSSDSSWVQRDSRAALSCGDKGGRRSTTPMRGPVGGCRSPATQCSAAAAAKTASNILPPAAPHLPRRRQLRRAVAALCIGGVHSSCRLRHCCLRLLQPLQQRAVLFAQTIDLRRGAGRVGSLGGVRITPAPIRLPSHKSCCEC